ncbi:MAG: cation transporter [Acidobacteria bacterium]|nr:cation transporter [Acidobacteriota bacterium]
MKDKSFIGASVVVAIMASFCCILPIVFALTGITVVGAAATFAQWRPYLLAGTFGLLGLGFYFAYRRTKEHCEPGSACARPTTRRSGRLLLWFATVAVIAFAAFPHYSAPVAQLLLRQDGTEAAPVRQAAPQLEHLSLTIEGMDCATCAAAIEKKLKAVPGVQEARVSYEGGRAEIDYDPNSASIGQLEKAIQEAGYRSRKT